MNPMHTSPHSQSRILACLRTRLRFLWTLKSLYTKLPSASGAKSRLFRLWKDSLAHVPGTTPFRRRCRSVVTRRAKNYIKQFKDIRTLDAETKLRLLQSIRYYETRLAAMDVRSQNFMAAIFIFIVALIFAIGLATAKSWVSILHSIQIWLSPIFVYVMAGYLLVFLIIWWLILMPKSLWRPIPSNLLLLPLLAGATVALMMVVLGNPSYGRSVGTLSASSEFIDLGIRVLIMSTFVSFCLFLVMVHTSRRWRNAIYPDGVVIHELLRILSMVERKPIRWTDLGFKKLLIDMLEEVAVCIQYDLPRRLRSFDAVTDIWLQGMAEQIAATLRMLKKWICISRSDTREYFIKRIADSLIHAASGDWDSFERAEPEKFSQVQLWRSRVASFLWVIAPVLLAWAFQQTPLAFSDAVYSYVKIGVFIWVVVRLLLEFDPLFSATIAAVRDVAQFLPFVGKGKKE